MPPPSGDASDGRSSYDSRFKSKAVTLEDILQGAQPPLPWLDQLGPVYKCNKLLDGGGLGSLLSLAKKYPRALVLVQDRPYLLCLKVEADGMDLCSYKWLKKLVDIVRVTRLPSQGFSMGSARAELALEFNEIDPDTGGNLEEVLSFKEPEANRFMRDLDEARKTARKLQLEMGASKAAQAAPTASASRPAPAQAPPPPQFDATFDDSFGDFSRAAPAAAPAPAAPAPPAQASYALDNPFEEEQPQPRAVEKAEPAAASAMDPFVDAAPAPAHMAAAPSTDPFDAFAAAPAVAPAPTPAADPFALTDVKAALPPAAPAEPLSGSPASLLDM